MQSRYEAVLAALKAGVVIHAADTEILEANERARDLLGIRDLEGRLATDPQWVFLEADHSPMPLERFPVMQVLESRLPVEALTMIIHPPTGPDVTIEVSALPVTDEAGQIEQIVVSFIDVTPWAEAERALAASEALLHVVLDNVGQNILRLDEDLRVDYVNAGVARMLGHPETPVIGRSLVDLGYPAPGLIDWSDHCQKVLTTARPDTFECCEHTSLGERWHELTVLPQVASDGTVAHVIVTHRDVTERKEAESSARVRQAQYEAAQLIASFGSWSMDLATQRITWSEELFRILGLDPSQTAPDIAHQESLYTNESWQRLSAAISEAQASGVPYELELETRRPDGSNGWVLTRGEAVRDLNGAIIGLQGVAADVTESRRAAAELTKLTTYDPLTGLPNRSALFDEISRTTSIGHHAGRHTAVLMVDLDHFKDINDTLGHESGDELLIAAGARISNGAPPGSFVARFGADEFALVASSLDEPGRGGCPRATTAAGVPPPLRHRRGRAVRHCQYRSGRHHWGRYTGRPGPGGGHGHARCEIPGARPCGRVQRGSRCRGHGASGNRNGSASRTRTRPTRRLVSTRGRPRQWRRRRPGSPVAMEPPRWNRVERAAVHRCRRGNWTHPGYRRLGSTRGVHAGLVTWPAIGLITP